MTTAYAATFTNGQTIILKASGREYSHAWQATSADGTTMTGWARTEELARKAAASEVSRWTVKPTRGGLGQYYRNRTFTPRPGVKSEIVAVVR